MTYENHPFAEVWPSLVGDEFDKLLADIRDNGQRLPIILHGSKILDGRNRYRACLTLGIEPKFEVYNGTEEQARLMVRSLNEHRRHLTSAQKRDAVKQLIAANPDMSARQIADRVNVHHETVTAVKQEIPTGENRRSEIVRKVSTRGGRTMTVYNVANREKRDEEIAKRRKQGQSNTEICRAMKLPSSTVYDVVQRLRGKPRGKTTAPVIKARPSLSSVPALTREQVDPEFTGTAIEFVDKYGHVQMETAEKRATSRFTDWAIVVGYLAKKFKDQPALPEVDLNWLRKPRQADVERMRAALEVLKPIIDKADEMLKRANGS